MAMGISVNSAFNLIVSVSGLNVNAMSATFFQTALAGKDANY
jgi:hypothetical protein